MSATLQKKLSFSLLTAIIAAGSFLLVQPSFAAKTVTFAVNTTTDENTNNSVCSLREAIIAANTSMATYNGCVATGGTAIAIGDAVIIELTGGSTYPLTITGADEDASATGDLDIINWKLSFVHIRSNNGSIATVSAAGIADRVFDLLADGEDVTFEKIKIEGGNGVTIGAGVKMIQISGTVSFIDSVISSNSATSHGGGIYANGVTKLTLLRTLVSSNTTTLLGYAGGITSFSTTIIITDSIIQNNTGGGMYVDGALTMSGTLVEGNSGPNGAGNGLEIFGSASATITNSTFSANTGSAHGGGVNKSGSGSLTIDSVSFISNQGISGSQGGEAIFVSGGAVTIKNALFAGNTNKNGTLSHCWLDAGTLTSLGNNLEQIPIGGSTGCKLTAGTDIVTSASFISIVNTLADNGGPTKTHALVPGSPAINKGGVGQTKDQRGALRPQGIATDIGAFEIGEVSIGDATAVTEGNSGTKTMSFTATLTAAQPNAVSVSYATQAGTAASESDFQAGSGTLSFAAGETTKTVIVTINGDTQDESDETVNVVLSNPSGIIVNDGTGSGTITDDDEPAPPPPAGTISIADATATEGDIGTKIMSFLVTLSAPQSSTVRANYATKAVTATAGTDYVTKSGTITFLAGETQNRIDISVKGDTVDEPNETFEVTLSALLNITAGDLTGVGTILDDDAAPAPPPSESGAPQTPPTVSVGDAGLVEGDKGTTKTMTFTVFLSAAQSGTATVEYATSAKDASANVDYAPTSGVITFAPNETKKTIDITLFGDAIDEKDETFTVTLSKLTNLTAGQLTATGIIIDDDEAATAAPSEPVLPPSSETSTSTPSSPSPAPTTPNPSPAPSEGSPAAKNITCPLTLGKPYKHPSHPAVWLITLDDFDPKKTTCARRVFKNPDVYDSYGFDRWSDVITVSKAVLESVPQHTIPFIEWGPERLYLHGELVKTPSDPKVYILLGTKKHPIDAEQTFFELELDFAAILDVTKTVLDSYATGTTISGPFSVPNGALIQYAGASKVYLLENNTQKHITTEAAFAKNNFSWNGILTLPKDFPVFASGVAVK